MECKFKPLEFVSVVLNIAVVFVIIILDLNSPFPELIQILGHA